MCCNVWSYGAQMRLCRHSKVASIIRERLYRLSGHQKRRYRRQVSGIFPLLGALIDEDERVRIDAYFTCHGGITYSGGGENSTYPIDSNLWWFGFDCAHYGDGKDLDLAIETFPEFAQQNAMTKAIEDMYPTYEIVRSTEYVVDNCKELADQLAQFSCIVK